MILPVNGNTTSGRMLLDEYGIVVGSGEGELSKEDWQYAWGDFSPDKVEQIKEIMRQVEDLGARLRFLITG